MTLPPSSVRDQLRALGVPADKVDAVAPDPARLEVSPATNAMLESKVESEGDKLMLAFGFEVVRLSQRRASKLTAGLPDRRYYHRRRQLSCWWEVKSTTGRQRPDQREFQAMVEAVGETYLLGTYEVLRDWLVSERVARWDGKQLEPVREDELAVELAGLFGDESPELGGRTIDIPGDQ